jgi:5-methylcytosine-specific restriction endonuclease McrA
MTDCLHEKRELRVRASVGFNVVQQQCDACGRGLGEAVPLLDFPRDRRAFPRWLHAKRPNAKSREYAEHLRSPGWKALRLLVLDRDGYLCQPCARKGYEVEATDAGHLTYERFSNELLTDLEACCKACNAEERLQRIGG